MKSKGLLGNTIKVYIFKTGKSSRNREISRHRQITKVNRNNLKIPTGNRIGTVVVNHRQWTGAVAVNHRQWTGAVLILYREKPWADAFAAELTHCVRRAISVLVGPFHTMEERTPPGTLCKGSITLTPKPYKYTKETITTKNI